MHLRRRTSSTPGRADGRGHPNQKPRNRDARPFHCLGRKRHRWGTAFASIPDRRTGIVVRREYCKRPLCVAVRDFPLGGGSS